MSQSSVRPIPLDQLHPNPLNPRVDVGDVTELAASLASVGQLQNLVVTPAPNGYLVLIGHRRRAAAALAGWTALRCEVRDRLSDADQLEIMLAENLHREGLDHVAIARALRRLHRAGHSHSQIAAALGKAKSWVGQHLALLRLPKIVRRYVESRRLGFDVAFRLSQLPTELVVHAADTILSHGWPRQRTLAFLASLQDRPAKPDPRPLRPLEATFRDDLHQQLDAPELDRPRLRFRWPSRFMSQNDKRAYLAAHLDRVELLFRFPATAGPSAASATPATPGAFGTTALIGSPTAGTPADLGADDAPEFRAQLPPDEALAVLHDLTPAPRRVAEEKSAWLNSSTTR